LEWSQAKNRRPAKDAGLRCPTCERVGVFDRFGPGAGDGLSLQRYLDFDVSTGSRRIDSGHNLVNKSTQSGPLLIAENDEGDFPRS
jgi:hypothetical protein